MSADRDLILRELRAEFDNENPYVFSRVNRHVYALLKKAYFAGAAAERAAVVRHLRSEEPSYLADDIERGEHSPEGPEGSGEG